MESFNYQISLKKKLNEDERKILLKLYQPILGVQATSIYFTLIEEVEVVNKLTNLALNEKRLMRIVKLTNAKLMDGIHKLEGLKLLKRRYKKAQNLVIFQVQAPLDSNSFFDNVLLNDMLKKALGDEDYEVTRYCFLDEEISVDDSEDLTVSFVEAFPEETSEISCRNLVVEPEKPTKLDSKSLDFSNLELELIKNNLPTSILTKAVKKMLLNNTNFLNLSEVEIVEAINEAFDSRTQTLDKNLLKISLATAFSKIVSTKKQNQIEQLKTEFKQMEPNDYLELLIGSKPSLSSQKLIQTLITEYHLSKENINCLLNYSVLKNGGQIIEPYILKIANTLNKKQLTQLDEVMNHLKTAHTYTLQKNQTLDSNDQQWPNQIQAELSIHPVNIIDLPEPNKYFDI